MPTTASAAISNWPGATSQPSAPAALPTNSPSPPITITNEALTNSACISGIVTRVRIEICSCS